MHEKLLFTAVEAQYRYIEKSGGFGPDGDCDVQVSETALILAEPQGNHLKVPLSYVSGIADEDYSLHVLIENGDRLAVMFRDGRAVSRKVLNDLAPGIWEKMEERLEAFGIKGSCDFLKKYNDTGHGAIGFKKGLMGDLTGEYVWLLIPVRGNNGRFVALEAGDNEGTSGRATYFFRMPDQFASNPDEYIQLLNYNLLIINFRREPIYLRDEMLNKPAYQHYRYAIERLPSLRFLRARFAGRVTHSSEEAWARVVDRLINR